MFYDCEQTLPCWHAMIWAKEDPIASILHSQQPAFYEIWCCCSNEGCCVIDRFWMFFLLHFMSSLMPSDLCVYVRWFLLWMCVPCHYHKELEKFCLETGDAQQQPDGLNHQWIYGIPLPDLDYRFGYRVPISHMGGMLVLLLETFFVPHWWSLHSPFIIFE